MKTLWLITNARSGSGGCTAAIVRDVTARFESLGYRVMAAPGAPLREQIQRSVADAPDVVIVAGGDGTIRAVAHAHHEARRPIGILPFGTMNMIAHELRIPNGLEQAIGVIAAGHRRRVDLADVGGETAMHSVLLGMPARLARHREARRGGLGIPLIVSFVVHALMTLRRDPVLTVRPEAGDVPARGRSMMALVGDLGDRMLPMPERRSVDAGRLTLLIARTDSAFDAIEVLVTGALGNIRDDPRVDIIETTAATVVGPRRRIHVLLDGEARLLPCPVRITLEKRILEVFTPVTEPASTAPRLR